MDYPEPIGNEPTGTRQMKWLDSLLAKYRLDSIEVKTNFFKRGKLFWGLNMDSREVVYPIDHRKMLETELVFDLDLKKPVNKQQQLYSLAYDIYVYAKSLDLEPILCHSGGTGMHVHIFADSVDERNRIRDRIIRDLYLEDYCGIGRTIDQQIFRHSHFIRAIGGRKFYSQTSIVYKTVINSTDFSQVTDKNKVRFPYVSWHNRKDFI